MCSKFYNAAPQGRDTGDLMSSCRLSKDWRTKGSGSYNNPKTSRSRPMKNNALI